MAAKASFTGSCCDDKPGGVHSCIKHAAIHAPSGRQATSGMASVSKR